MHFGDYTFIFLLALVLFGPKKLPEIGRQVGKLLAEFRRASNEFKFQIQEELRNMEDEERRKKAAEAEAARAASSAVETPATEAALPGRTEPMILPPAIGESVSASKPFAVPDPKLDAAEPPLEAEAASEVGAEPSRSGEEAFAPARAPLPGDDLPTHPSLAVPVAESLSQSTNGAHSTTEEAAAHHD